MDDTNSEFDFSMIILSNVSIITRVRVIDLTMPFCPLTLTMSPISNGSITQINKPAMEFENMPLVANANAVLSDPVMIALYSSGMLVKEGNPSIIK